ncbi:MAG: maleylpyruvate isomerase N-terminal domain-containing protein [Acidimicrobiia bacterium]
MDDRSRDLDDEIAGCAAAHQRLLAHIDELGDDAVRRPSLLPGWTVGHVLTHLARNADSLVRMLEGAERDEILDQYEGGADARAADIEAGSGRSAAGLVRDVRQTIWQLEGTWATTSPAAWARSGRGTRGDLLPCKDLPFRRWREVEVHHADLGLPGFTFDDWSSDYVRRELPRELMTWRSRLPMGIADLPPAALALSPNRRLAWLLGRHHVDSLPEQGPWR